MNDTRNEPKTPKTRGYISIAKILESFVIPYSKITRFVQDFVSKTILKNLTNYQKAQTTLKKIYIVF